MALNWRNMFKNMSNKRSTTSKELKEHYDIGPIDATGATYRMIVGQRSNGKTYSVCKHIIEDYFKEGKRGAYIRRYEESITPKNIQALFNPHLNLIWELSGNRYNGVFYRAKEFWFVAYDEGGKIVDKSETSFCIAAAINTSENTKGEDRGEVHTIVFDEFMTRSGYLNNEFVRYMNLLSTLIRDRESATIYMLANTVNKYCPYFAEMGLKNIEKLPKGEIAVYSYGTTDLTVAVELCDEVKATKKTASKYFAFDNPQLQMITKGEWEFQVYPRPPYKIFDEDIVLRFYIQFAEQLLCCEIIHSTDKKYCNDVFIFVHPQTKDIDIEDDTIMYVSNFSSCRMHVRYLNDAPTPGHKLISDLIRRKSVCFSDNDTGEVFRNWLIETQGVKLW
jgi:hypothetical protein